LYLEKISHLHFISLILSAFYRGRFLGQSLLQDAKGGLARINTACARPKNTDVPHPSSRNLDYYKPASRTPSNSNTVRQADRKVAENVPRASLLRNLRHTVARMRPVNQKRPEVVQTLAAARSFILVAGRPVPISELLEEGRRKEVPIGGKTVTATLDAGLRYSHEFVNVKGRGWWLKGQPIPQPNGSAAGIQEIPAAHEVHPPSPEGPDGVRGRVPFARSL
jgi:hypothetical protein